MNFPHIRKLTFELDNAYFTYKHVKDTDVTTIGTDSRATVSELRNYIFLLATLSIHYYTENCTKQKLP